MLKSIRDFFERNLITAERVEPSPHALELAAAALLIEVVRCDATISDDERAAVQEAVRAQFALPTDAAQALIRLAEDEVRQSNDLFQFTSLINRHFDQPQKIRMVELMWRAALADEHINAHEHHVMRRIAGLLHVTHGDYIAAKTRAQRDAPA